MRFVQKNAPAAFVMPTRNRRSRLAKTLMQLAATPGPDVEVIVVDNDSDDKTGVSAKEQYPDLKLIRLKSNLGTMARNIGVEAAHAPVVIMLDDDSWPQRGVAEKLIAALDDGALGIAACMIRLPDKSWEEGGSKFVHIGCGAAFRREEFLRFGGYPPVYETYVEEYELAYRCLEAGKAVRFDESWTVCHEPAARDDFNYMVEKLTANNIYLAWKFFPDDEASRFIDWFMRRYEILADKKCAMKGFQAARDAADKMKSEALKDRSILSDETLDLVVCRRNASHIFRKSSDVHGPLAFYRAGKEILDLVEAAQKSGREVAAIYDSGLMADAGRIGGVDVLPLDRAQEFSGTFVIGGTSPGFIKNTRLLADKLRVGPMMSL